jgi:integrase
MSTHLFRRGGRYYIRRRIPADLLEHYQGKKEIQRALGTADPSVAAVVCRAAGVQMDEEFAAARAERLAKPSAAAGLGTMEPDEWGEPGQNNGSLAEIAHEAAYDRLKDAIRGVLSERGHISPRPQPVPTAFALTGVRNVDDAERTFAVLFQRWVLERKPQKRSQVAVELAIDRFRSLMGNVPIPSITKLTAVEFKNKALDAGWTGAVIDRVLELVSIMFNYAVSQAWIEVNPARGVKVTRKKKKNAKSARPPFDEPTLNSIFSSRIYSNGERPRGCAGEAVYWLPLLGTFTGARIEELCQISPDDVYEESYRDATGKEHRAWVLLLTNEGADQGLKNDGSRRRFPIHSELLSRGFVQYTQSFKGGTRIFPALKANKYGEEAANWSIWWLNFIRRECTVTDKRMVFHSFRHYFKDVCRACGISKEVSDALQGHAEGDSAGDYGAEFYPLRALVEAMDRYTVHGVKLPTAPLLPASHS